MRPIGTMVATLARAKGETVVSLAAELGMHRNRLQDKIAGRRDFSESEIQRIAAHFGVPPGHLFEDPLELLGLGTPSSGDPACVTGDEQVELVAA